MGYFIAIKNEKTGRFELEQDEGKPGEYPSLEKAMEPIRNCLFLYGKLNVKLLKEEMLSVEVKVNNS